MQRSLALARCGGPRNIDAALEVSAIFDDDAGRLDIADQVGPGAQRDALGCVHVSFDGARDNYFFGVDARVDFALGADGQTVIHLQLTAQFSVHNDFFVAGERPLNAQGLANHRNAYGTSG